MGKKENQPGSGKEFWKKAGIFAAIGAVALIGFDLVTDR